MQTTQGGVNTTYTQLKTTKVCGEKQSNRRERVEKKQERRKKYGK